jgi:hypothetical protein
MKSILFSAIIVLSAYSEVYSQACTIAVSNQAANITNETFNADGTCNVTVDLSFNATINSGSKYMGMNITSPVNYYPPAQVSPAGANGAGTFLINTFKGIQFNNINCATFMSNGIQLTLWMSNAASAGGGSGPYQCQSSVLTFPVANTVLPLQIIKFDVTERDGRALLTWINFAGYNNKEFIIQRKINNDNFQEEAIIPTRTSTGAGFTNPTYQILLPEPLNEGDYFYRIESISQDGEKYYSEIKVLKGINSGLFVNIFPNPSPGEHTSVILPDKAGLSEIAITDISGRLVQNWKHVNSSTILLHGLQPGIYFVKVWFFTINEMITRKLIVVK